MNKKKVLGWVLVGIGGWLSAEAGVYWLTEAFMPSQIILPIILLYFGIDFICKGRKGKLKKDNP